MSRRHHPTKHHRHPPKHHGSGKDTSALVFIIIYSVICLAVTLAIVLLPKKEHRPTEAETTREPAAKIAPPPKTASLPPQNVARPPAKPKVSEVPRFAPQIKVEPKPPVEPKSGLTANMEKQIEELYPLPKVRPLLQIVGNWQSIPKKAIPRFVAIRKSVEFEIKREGLVVAKGKLPVGSLMTPIDLKGDYLKLSSGSSLPITTTLRIEETDLKQRIEARYDLYVKKRTAYATAQRETERKRQLNSIAVEAEMAKWNDGSDARFNPLKESLRKGVGVFSHLDASKWRWGGTESVDGVEYEVGFVVVLSEAAFGVTEQELKALIREGSVEKWIDVATGQQI